MAQPSRPAEPLPESTERRCACGRVLREQVGIRNDGTEVWRCGCGQVSTFAPLPVEEDEAS